MTNQTISNTSKTHNQEFAPASQMSFWDGLDPLGTIGDLVNYIFKRAYGKTAICMKKELTAAEEKKYIKDGARWMEDPSTGTMGLIQADKQQICISKGGKFFCC